MPTRNGSIKLFRFLGIDVYIHWGWFLAFLYFTSRPHAYSNYGWSALEILALFLLVLTHEFGHALACRSETPAADRAPADIGSPAGLQL